MNSNSLPIKPRVKWSWRQASFRVLVYQTVMVILLLALAYFLWRTAASQLAARQIRSGFDFLAQSAGFGIGESMIGYQPNDSYARAFLAGLSNTLRVSLIGIVLTTLLGVLIGIGRLSGNFLIRSMCTGYVEIVRNTPVLLQLFIWYLALTEFLPGARDALQPVAGVYLSKSGMQFPFPIWDNSWLFGLAGLAIATMTSVTIRQLARRHRERTGVQPPVGIPTLILLIALPFLGWMSSDSPGGLDFPSAGTFAITGGAAVSPEFMALLLGLTVYTASYIAEIVRAGILSVSHGQKEASIALGLSRLQTLRLVQLPQARRVIIPSLTSQYLNLTKNSSLAVAVGYPDLVSIANTSINQTGQAVECILVIMSVYLICSLCTSLYMNWYNRHAAIKER